MRRALAIGAAGALALLATACGSESGTQAVVKTVTVTVGAGVTAPDPVVETTSSEPAAPDGKYTYRCNYILGDFTSNTSSGYRFVADVTLTNTGNVGTTSKVTAIWDQIGTDPVKKTKTVKVKAGRKLRVGITVPVSQEQIDLHQAAGGECRVRSTITGNFGPVS